MNERDIRRRGLRDGDVVDLETAAKNQVTREVQGLRVATQPIAEGRIAAYYPEASRIVTQ